MSEGQESKDRGHPGGGSGIACQSRNRLACGQALLKHVEEPLRLAFGLAGVMPILLPPAKAEGVSVVPAPAMAS